MLYPMPLWQYSICFILNCVIVLFLLRIYLQACGADFYNSISQSIHKLTRHAVDFLGNKNWHNINISAGAVVIIALAVKYALIYLVFLDIPQEELLNPLYFLKPFLLLIKLSGIIFFTVLLADALLSWFPGNRFSALTSSLVNPVLNDVRRFVPRLGMLDLSSLIVFILLYLADYLILKTLITLFNSFGIFLWYSVLL